MENSKPLLSKNKVFVLLFSFLYFVSFLFLFSRRGLGLYFHPFADDSFMDLFNMASHPFNLSYPPLSLIPFKLLYLILPPGLVTTSIGLRGSCHGAFFLMCYIFAFCAVFLYTMFFAVRGDSKRKVFYSILFLFSGIVFWATERANVMSFAFLLSLLFVIFYLDESEQKKRLSYIFIALAISLKLYPAAFLLLLLEKKDIKGIFSVVLEVVVIFVFSFIVCRYLDYIIRFEESLGLLNYMKDAKSYLKVAIHLAAAFCVGVAGVFALYQVYRQNWKFIKFSGAAFVVVFAAMGIFLHFFKDVNFLAMAKEVFMPIFNALKFGKIMTSSVEGVNVSFKNFFLLVNFLLTGKTSFSKPAVLALCKFLCVVICVFSFIFNRRIWKKLASAALLCVYVPDFAGTYLLIYLLIPLLFFVNDNEDSKINYLFACFFAIATTFLIVPYKFNVDAYYSLTGSFVVISISVFCLFLALVGNAIYELTRRKQEPL